MEPEDYAFLDLFTLTKVTFKKSSVKVIEVIEEDTDKFYLFTLRDGKTFKVNSDNSNDFIRKQDF